MYTNLVWHIWPYAAPQPLRWSTSRSWRKMRGYAVTCAGDKVDPDWYAAIWRARYVRRSFLWHLFRLSCFFGHIHASFWYTRACGQRLGKSRRSHCSPSSGVRMCVVCGVCGVYVFVTRCVHIHDMNHSYGWSIHTNDMIRSNMWLESLTCMARNTYTCEIIHSSWFRHWSCLSPTMHHESASVLIKSTWERKLE